MAAWLAPLYAVFPSVNTLLVAEMVIVALGAIPLYLLARDRLGAVLGLLIAVLYFAYLPVQYGSLYEIRFRMMAMAWLCFLLFFVERERYWAMLPFLFLALSCRLDTRPEPPIIGPPMVATSPFREFKLPSSRRQDAPCVDPASSPTNIWSGYEAAGVVASIVNRMYSYRVVSTAGRVKNA